MAIATAFLLFCAAFSGAEALRMPLTALHGSQRLFGVPRALGSRPPSQLHVFGKEKPPKEPSAEDISRELSRHYRTLGVREDAEFDEISDQTETLKEKYKGDMKKVKTIEIAKDRILELKLAQRLQGSLAIASGAVEYDAEREMYEKSTENRKRKMPAWMKYISKMYCPPTAQERTRFAIYFGGSAVASFVVPNMQGAIQGLTFMLCTSMLYMKRAGLQFSKPGEAYSAQMPDIRMKWVGVTLLVTAMAYTAGTYFMRGVISLLGPVLVPGSPEFAGVASNLGYFMACSYLITNPAAMVAKRKKKRR